jgi:hypothetical protein
MSVLDSLVGHRREVTFRSLRQPADRFNGAGFDPGSTLGWCVSGAKSVQRAGGVAFTG